jgi:hypothetical protein
MMLAPPTSSADAFVTLTFACSANTIEVSVPPAPPAHAADDLKARSFHFLADPLAPHSALYSSAKLFAVFAGHVPTSAYNATLEAKSVCCIICRSVFHVENLVALGFRDHLDQPISSAITADATKRPPGVTYFAFRSTVYPNAVDACLSVPSHSFEFLLAVPQTMLGPNAPPVLAAAETARKCLDFHAPYKNSAPSPAPATDALVNALDIAAMDDPGKAAIGTASSTDVMFDCTPDCFVLLSAAQIQNLVLCSAAAAAASALSILPALSPKMTAVLASTSISSSSSYFGTPNFLDSQFSFDAVFPSPVPLLVAPSATSTSVDSVLLLASLLSRLSTAANSNPLFPSSIVITLVLPIATMPLLCMLPFWL